MRRLDLQPIHQHICNNCFISIDKMTYLSHSLEFNLEYYAARDLTEICESLQHEIDNFSSLKTLSHWWYNVVSFLIFIVPLQMSDDANFLVVVVTTSTHFPCRRRSWFPQYMCIECEANGIIVSRAICHCKVHAMDFASRRQNAHSLLRICKSNFRYTRVAPKWVHTHTSRLKDWMNECVYCVNRVHFVVVLREVWFWRADS